MSSFAEQKTSSKLTLVSKEALVGLAHDGEVKAHGGVGILDTLDVQRAARRAGILKVHAGHEGGDFTGDRQAVEPHRHGVVLRVVLGVAGRDIGPVAAGAITKLGRAQGLKPIGKGRALNPRRVHAPGGVGRVAAG